MLTRENRQRARRRVMRRRRQVAACVLLFVCTLLTMAGFKLASALTNNEAGSGGSGRSTSAAVSTKKPSGTATTLPQSSAKPSSPQSSSAGSTSPTSPRETAVTATGEYIRAPGSSAPHGTGPLRTYRVEVETGLGQDAQAFANAADVTLANPSSWTGQGLWTLQRVDGDAVVDFVIRLASPATVDNVCASAGLDTKGHVSCSAGAFVMVNVDRWVKAVPDYRGDVVLYRQYVINHEVGHQLGYGHQACPGLGRLAPVMQQQTLGLNGCVKNGWPYANGKFITGPATR